MNKPLSKPGKHGTLYLYEIVYTDPTDDCMGEMTQRLWAYNAEHLADRFYGALDSDGWEMVRYARVPVEGGMHRAAFHKC